MQMRFVFSQCPHQNIGKLRSRLYEHSARRIGDCYYLSRRQRCPRFGSHNLLCFEQLIYQPLAIRELPNNLSQDGSALLGASIYEIAKYSIAEQRDRIQWANPRRPTHALVSCVGLRWKRLLKPQVKLADLSVIE